MISFPTDSLDPRLKRLLGELPYVIATGLLLAVMLLVRKTWETNDDIGMMMTSQGYGLAATPSSGIVFSNVIWGWIVTHTPSIADVDSYTLLTYGALFTSCAAVLLALRRSTAPPTLAAVALLAMFVPTFATPQFTLVAGYLAVAGFALLFAWKDSRSAMPLCIAGLLFAVAGLVRLTELLFVALVVLPFLVGALRVDNDPHMSRRWLFTVLAVCALLAIAHFVDLQYYAASDWSTFEAMNRVRVPFTDYGLSRYYYAHPDALKPFAVSLNDVGLLARWFYPDPKVFQPDAFAPLVAAVPWSERIALDLQHYSSLAEMFQRPQFLLLFCLPPLLLLLAWRRSPALYAWLTVLAVMVLLYLAGRPGMVRVYTPAAAAVLVLMLTSSAQVSRQSLRVFGILMLVLVTAMAAWRVYPRPQGEAAAAALETSLCALPGDKPLAVWGNASFPYEALYRPAPDGHPRCDAHFYALGTLQLAPYSLETVQRETGAPDLVGALMGGTEIYLFTSADRISLLTRYFAEHYQRALSARELLNKPHLHLYALRVSGPATAPPVPAQTSVSGDDQDNSGG